MKKTIITTKTKNTVSKRWSVIRATTGSVVRSFETRDDARSYKTTARGSFKIFDNVNQTVVR